VTPRQQKTAQVLADERAASAETSVQGSEAIVPQTCVCGAPMTVHPWATGANWTTATCTACPKSRFIFGKRGQADDRQAHRKSHPIPWTTHDQLEWLESY